LNKTLNKFTQSFILIIMHKLSKDKYYI